jgi:hypothetical protein
MDLLLVRPLLLWSSNFARDEEKFSALIGAMGSHIPTEVNLAKISGLYRPGYGNFGDVWRLTTLPFPRGVITRAPSGPSIMGLSTSAIRYLCVLAVLLKIAHWMSYQNSCFHRRKAFQGTLPYSPMSAVPANRSPVFVPWKVHCTSYPLVCMVPFRLISLACTFPLSEAV